MTSNKVKVHLYDEPFLLCHNMLFNILILLLTCCI
nr:MAG TPA: hypothetical protein [Crassvirales sp.]